MYYGGFDGGSTGSPYSPYSFPSGRMEQSQPIMVNGEEGARAYPLGPNRTVPLFDKSQMYFYLKSTDSGGFGSLRKFRYEEIFDRPTIPEAPMQDYVTREEFEAYKKEHQNGERVSAATSSRKQRSGGGSSGGAGTEGDQQSG